MKALPVETWSVNCSSRLFVVRGKPEEVFPKLFSQWKVTKLTYEYDTEPYSLSRDKTVMTLAEESGVEVVHKVSHTLYDIERYYSYGMCAHLWPSKTLNFLTFFNHLSYFIG